MSNVEKTFANTDIHSVQAERQYSERNDKKLGLLDKGKCTKCGRIHALNKCPAYGTTCKNVIAEITGQQFVAVKINKSMSYMMTLIVSIVHERCI